MIEIDIETIRNRDRQTVLVKELIISIGGKKTFYLKMIWNDIVLGGVSF